MLKVRYCKLVVFGEYRFIYKKYIAGLFNILKKYLL